MIRKLATVPFGLLALSACTAASSDYPSLAIRDAERPRGMIEAPEAEADPATPIPPALGAETLQQIAQLEAQANAAHQQFLRAAPAARRAVSAGAGASRASDAWASAQVALADLETQRSKTAIPLADLDALYVSQATAFGPVSRIAAARDAVIRLVAEEDRVLAGLRSRVR